MKPGLKQSLEYLRRAEIEFLQNASSVERDEDIQAVKSEIDEFRNVVWSHTLSLGKQRGQRAKDVLEAMRLQRVVEMLRALNKEQRLAVVDPANGITLSDINMIVQNVCDHAHI